MFGLCINQYTEAPSTYLALENSFADNFLAVLFSFQWSSRYLAYLDVKIIAFILLLFLLSWKSLLGSEDCFNDDFCNRIVSLPGSASLSARRGDGGADGGCGCRGA